MQGKKDRQEKLFITFQLSDHVPSDNFYRRLSEQLDLKFLYKLTAPYYGTEGQKSIDPVVFMKLMLVGYLENINSDRRIIAVSRLRLDILYFIGYDLDEELPWHSTLSRTRQLYSQHVFNELFKRVLKECIDKGMISGRRQAVDGFFIKANASLDSLAEKDILEDAVAYGEELKINEDKEDAIIKPISPDQQETGLKPKKDPSNDTHYSPSDPDAKLSVKPGKTTALNYLGQVAVDTASHMITHVQVFTAEKRDSECLAAVLTHVKNNLLENEIALQEIVADTGYSSGDALKALLANKITGYIPNRGTFNYEREGLTFNPDGDYYECTNGKRLTYRGMQLDGGYWMKRYLLGRKQCAGCPFQHKCSAYGKKLTQIRETIDKPYYDRMHVRMQTRKASRLMKLRQSTVEPVIGTLVNYTGIKKVNTVGLEQANKCLTIAAIAYNLKKMLKYRPRLIRKELQALNNEIKKLLNVALPTYQNLFISITLGQSDFMKNRPDMNKCCATATP
jgi:transposase